jgi:predicted nucleic acid-binding protein
VTVAYVDSSVLLRFVLEQPHPLDGIDRFEGLVTSTLAQTECLRVVDNARLRGEIDQAEHDARRQAVYTKLRGVERVAVSASVLGRAEAPFPAPISTLDAIHVATALQWRDRGRPDLVFATHDTRQARVAGLLGFDVIGV